MRSNAVSAPQRIYRFYSFDLARNAVTADFIKAASDEEAIAKVEAAGFGSKCEIWDEKRLVAQLEAERRTA
jgi:hypothetical protein